MPEKLFIHIGPHKTGTTYIQQTLSKHRDYLHSIGLHYPKIPSSFNSHRIAHHTVVQWIKERNSSEIRAFIEALKGSTLLSSEEFSHLNWNQIEYFSHFISDSEVEIIYSKRRLGPLLVSKWKEYIKHGGTESWPVYFLAHLLDDSKRNLINGLGTLTHWSNVLGKSHIQILDYERCVEEGLDIADALLQLVLGPDAPNVGTGKSINPSLDATHVEILRLVNLHFQSEGQRPGPEHRKAFIKLLKKQEPEIEQALQIIRRDMVTISLSGTAPINALEREFRLFTDFQSSYQDHPKKDKYELPGERAIISPALINHVQKIAGKVQAKMR